MFDKHLIEINNLMMNPQIGLNTVNFRLFWHVTLGTQEILHNHSVKEIMK